MVFPPSALVVRQRSTQSWSMRLLTGTVMVGVVLATSATATVAWAAGTTISFGPPIVTEANVPGTVLSTTGIGDFTGDGLPDVVVAANSSTASLYLFPGTRSGAFDPYSSTALTGSGQVRGMAVGDVNGDGDLDVVIGENWPDHQLVVALGDGAGHFSLGTPVTLIPSPYTVALADLDADGDLDVVVGTYATPGAVGVLLGNGSGGFGAAAYQAIPDYASQLAVGDVNGDGDLDVATANTADKSASVLYGDGLGSLSVASTTLLTTFDTDATTALGIGIGDFNGDGWGELAVNAQGNSYAEGLYLINVRTSTAQFYDIDATPALVTVGDVTGDGIPDAVAAYSGSDELVIWAGNGVSGLVTPPYQQVMGLRTGFVAAGAYTPFVVDVDGDGFNDVVVVGANDAMATVLNQLEGGAGAGAWTEFVFSLPNGAECTSISPMRVQVGSMVTLPGADSNCRTMPGATVAGWTIPVPRDSTEFGSSAQPFPPGLRVRVVEGQRFTVVPYESVLTFTYDANVATADTCTSTGVENPTADDRGRRVWVPRADVTIARFPTQASCTPPGHALRGWSTRGDGTGTSYPTGEPLPTDWATSPTNRRTLYAVWSRASGDR